MYNLGNADKNMLHCNEPLNKYYDENIKIDINDLNNTHSIIAKYIKNGSNVLDIGCGSGYIGKLLLSKNCNVYGVDLDPEAVKVAKSLNCYQDVFNFSITDSKSKNYKNFFDKKIEFDYIILADVLEHVIDPAELICMTSKFLNKNGEILISIPNVAHMDVVRGLLNRTFNYNKIGILDSTHLRFFSKYSFVDLIESLDIKFCVKLIGKTINYPYFKDDYKNINEILNVDDEFYALQYVYALKFAKKFESNIDSQIIDYFGVIDKKLGEYKEMQNQLECCFDQLSSLEKKVKNQENELLNIYNSKSWKITKPLRRIRKEISKKNN